MIINNIPFNAELSDIINEVQSQLIINNIPLLQKTKETTDDIMVQCPYHKNGQEHKPSAGIRKRDGLFHCFTCGETHSLQEVISHCFGYYDDILGTFGWQWLLKNFISVNIEERKDVKLDLTRNSTNIIKKDKYVSEVELDSYRYIHPYMYKRKLTDEVIEIFDIGYDKASQCITFPIRDIDGNCLFIARRSVNTKYFNYPNGVEKPLYGLYEIYETAKTIKNYFPEEIIICESMLDALTCWVYGRFAIALNGLGNELQFKQLRELPCRKLILATDNDDAGMKARKRIRKNVKNKIIKEYILPERKKDINELTKEEFENLKEVF